MYRICFVLCFDRGNIMERIVPVKNQTLGMLKGRDCIFINSVLHDDKGNIIFEGEINGLLAENIKEDKQIHYTLTFHNVTACLSCELDTYENTYNNAHADGSCFNIVSESNWLKSLIVRIDYDKFKYKHYQIFTYDYVFNVIAVSYELNYN